MRSQSLLRCLALLVSAGTVCAYRLPAQQQTKNSSSIPMGSEQITLDGICITFNASMNSPEFTGLERIETPSGVELRRSKKIVKTFPDLVDVEIWAIPTVCNSRGRSNQPKDLGAEAVDALTFRFSWKRDFDLRPAETLDSVKKHFSGRNIWLFYIQVKGAEIPTTDHLILHIVGKEGHDLAKLSGRLL
jgi:hypothetical protein